MSQSSPYPSLSYVPSSPLWEVYSQDRGESKVRKACLAHVLALIPKAIIQCARLGIWNVLHAYAMPAKVATNQSLPFLKIDIKSRKQLCIKRFNTGSTTSHVGNLGQVS